VGGGAYRQGSGRPGAPEAGAGFRPSRDLAAKREAYAGGAASGSLGRQPGATGNGRGSTVERAVVPGERHYRDGDRVRHARFGDGIVVTSKLTRSDEEVTVAFRDPSVGRKTMLASIAGLELVG
jgi:DNA helicase-2/ATP-dependent DNA helicase PcrA